MEKKKRTIQMAEYFFVNAITFGLDFSIIWIFITFFHVNYLISATLGFLVASAATFAINRMWTFKGTRVGLYAGFGRSLTVATMTLLAILGAMFVFVQIFHIDYFTARISIALVAALWSFLLDAWWSFEVMG